MQKEASVLSMDDVLKYVRINKAWTDKEEQKALTLIDRRRCSLEHADSRIAAEINGLLNEFGRENGLKEGWWIDEMSTDDVFLNLLALVQRGKQGKRQ